MVSCAGRMPAVALTLLLAGIRGAGPHDADIVVSKCVMSPGKLVAWHVALDAPIGADRTSRGLRT